MKKSNQSTRPNLFLSGFQFIFLSIEREARKTNKDPGHLMTVAWCEHVQAQLKKNWQMIFSRLGKRKRSSRNEGIIIILFVF